MKITRNLLLIAAVKAKNLKIHKWMWSLMAISNDTLEKFKKLVRETNNDGFNVLQLAVMHNKLEIIQWIWQKLQRDVFNESEFQTFFNIHAPNKRNLVQLAAIHNKDVKVHEWLWEETKDCFSVKELKEQVEHCDEDDRNVMKFVSKNQGVETQIVLNLFQSKFKQVSIP